MGLLNFKPREITRALEQKLEISFKDTGELVGWYYLGGKRQIKFKIPHVHSKWSTGVINDVRRRSRLTTTEFKDLVDCPMSGAAYAMIVAARLSQTQA